MSSLKCSFCGYGIHYHDEPNGTEYIFCTLSKWNELEKENLTSSWLELEHDETFIYAWKCSKCGSFTFFDEKYHAHVTDVYAPRDEMIQSAMKEPCKIGLFWDDELWYKITENEILASEILKKYPQNFWLVKNAEEMRIYKDRDLKNCLTQYYKIEVAKE